jgi:hypothetical protein
MNKITKDIKVDLLKSLGATDITGDGNVASSFIPLGGIRIKIIDIPYKPKKRLLKKFGLPTEVEFQIEYLNNKGKPIIETSPIIASKGGNITIMNDDNFKCSYLVNIWD